MKTTESNKLIAEFMGGFEANVHKGKVYVFQSPPDQRMEKLGPVVWDNNETIFHDDEFKYHSSWDWLMPVVEKIGKMKYSVEIVISNAPSCTIKRRGIHTSFGSDMLNNVWRAAVQFIEWYNKEQH